MRALLYTSSDGRIARYFVMPVYYSGETNMTKRLWIMALALLAFPLFGQAAWAASCAKLHGAATLMGTAGGMLESARRQAGRSRISRNTRLDRAAQEQACYVARHGYNTAAPHHGANGSTPMVRVRAENYRACLSAENLAVNFPTAQGVVSEWMGSPKHHYNIMLPGVRDYGLGMAMLGNQPVWIMVLAKPC